MAFKKPRPVNVTIKHLIETQSRDPSIRAELLKKVLEAPVPLVTVSNILIGTSIRKVLYEKLNNKSI